MNTKQITAKLNKLSNLEFRPGMIVDDYGNETYTVIDSCLISDKESLDRVMRYDSTGAMQEALDEGNNDNGFLPTSEAVAVQSENGTTLVFLDEALEIRK